LRNLLWFWWVYLCLSFVFSLLQASMFSLYLLCLFFLMIMCCGVVLFWSSQYGVLEASCTWMAIAFYKSGKFPVIILLNILWFPFASYPSSMPMILRFCLLMELVSSCIFLSQVLSYLTNSFSYFPLISILPPSSEICLLFVLVCWSGLPLCFRFLFHSFFSGFPYHGLLPL
jgi:hypothetical protein